MQTRTRTLGIGSFWDRRSRISSQICIHDSDFVSGVGDLRNLNIQIFHYQYSQQIFLIIMVFFTEGGGRDIQIKIKSLHIHICTV